MARSALSIQEISAAGLVATYSAANVDGNSILNTSKEDICLHVKNGGGGSINVTLQTPASSHGEPIAERVVAVAAAAETFFGPFNRDVFNQSDGSVYVDYSGVTSVTVAVLRVKRV